MSTGSDGDPSTNGISRWRPFGQFSEIADSMKGERDCGESGVGARHLTETERRFVEQYTEAIGDPDPDVIVSHVEDNIREFDDQSPDIDGMIEAIRRDT